MTFRDDILSSLDDIRGIPGELGMRLFTVAVMSRTWSGERPGVGQKSDKTTPVMVAHGCFNARVRSVTSKDVIASGGLYTTEDVKVGPVTPPFLGSASDGDAIIIFDPPGIAGSGTELFFKITGPGYSAAGDWFKKVDVDTSKPFSYFLTLRKTAKVPVPT